MQFIKIKGYNIDVTQQGLIGSGQFGVVYKAYDGQNQPVCAKLMNVDKQDKVQLQREIDIVQALSKKKHRNLVAVHDVQQLEYENSQYQALIMEYLPNGDLQKEMNSKLAQSKWYSFDEIVKIIRDLFCGLFELYNNKIIHRDLKPANIMVGFDYKITDFGMGRYLDDMKKQQALTRKGSVMYASPQVMADKPFSAKADIYSLGIILYQLAFYGTYPGGYQITTVNMNVIKSFLRRAYDNTYEVPKIQIQAEPERQEQLRNLIQRMISYNEDDRPDWNQLIKHPLVLNVAQNLKPVSDVIVPINSMAIKSDTQLLLDSLFFDQKDPQYINAKFFAQVTEEKFQELNSQNKIYHILKLLIAKSYVAESVAQKFEESIKMADSPLKNYLLTSIYGYRANLLLNASGFSQGVMEMICQNIRSIYNLDNIQKAIDIFNKEQQFVDIKEIILDLATYAVSAFQPHANLTLLILKQLNNKDYQNFNQIMQIKEYASYMHYHKWFAYFYQNGLKNYQYKSPEEKKFKANVDYFLNLERSYPIEEYFKQSPNEIQDALDYINNKQY